MTVNKIISAEASDIKSVWLVCKECGTVQGYTPSKWNGGLPYECPNCPAARNWHDSEAKDYIKSLLDSLKDLAKLNTLPFEIRLQLECSDNETAPSKSSNSK